MVLVCPLDKGWQMDQVLFVLWASPDLGIFVLLFAVSWIEVSILKSFCIRPCGQVVI